MGKPLPFAEGAYTEHVYVRDPVYSGMERHDPSCRACEPLRAARALLAEDKP